VCRPPLLPDLVPQFEVVGDNGELIGRVDLASIEAVAQKRLAAMKCVVSVP